MRIVPPIVTGVVAILLFIGTAIPAHAAALTETQIQAILSLITSFGADSSTIANVNAALRGQATSPSFNPSTPVQSPPLAPPNYEQPPPRMTPCPSSNLTLSRGMSGEEVRKLQEFLTVHLDIGENIMTGYYGIKTEQYVREFQAQNGIAQVGQVGPLTRVEIARACSPEKPISSPPPSSVTLSASPTAGSVPLSVHFFVTDYSSTMYSIDFGDGQRGSMQPGSCPTNPLMGAPCSPANVNHTYVTTGTYAAMLLGPGCDPVPGQVSCLAIRPVLGTVKITVTGGD